MIPISSIKNSRPYSDKVLKRVFTLKWFRRFIFRRSISIQPASLSLASKYYVLYLFFAATLPVGLFFKNDPNAHDPPALRVALAVIHIGIVVASRLFPSLNRVAPQIYVASTFLNTTFFGYLLYSNADNIRYAIGFFFVVVFLPTLFNSIRSLLAYMVYATALFVAIRHSAPMPSMQFLSFFVYMSLIFGLIAFAFRFRMIQSLELNDSILKGLTDATFQGLCVLYKENIIDANESFAKLFNLGDSPPLPMPLNLLIDKDSFKVLTEKFKESTSVPPTEIVGIRKNGKPAELEVSGSQIKLHGDTEAYTILAFRSIEEQRWAEKEIAQLARMPGENPDPMLRIDTSARVLYANIASLPLLNDWNYTTGNQLPEKIINAVRTVLDKDENEEIAVFGGNRIYSLHFVPVKELNYVNIYGRDVTESIRTENMLREQQAKMAHASKMSALGEMAGGIAHEINNPLMVILGKATQIRAFLGSATPDLEKVNDAAGRIETTAMKIAKIVRGLRVFSRDGSADDFEAVSIQKIVEDTLDLCQEKLKNHAVNLTIAAISTELMVEARPTQIAQVLLNFISNAADAVEALPEKWIRVECEDKGEIVTISVTDSGTGIPKEIREKILQPFFTTKEIGKGTGLGLSISKGIIEAHKGKLRLDTSSPNTRFCIDLYKKIPTSTAKAA